MTSDIRVLVKKPMATNKTCTCILKNLQLLYAFETVDLGYDCYSITVSRKAIEYVYNVYTFTYLSITCGVYYYGDKLLFYQTDDA